MRFQLALSPTTGQSLLPINYHYPLSAAIYKIIHQADENYATFLHDNGYRLPNGKSFKLFCFSDLRVPYQVKGDRLQINGSPASLIIGFHADEAATNFIKGLFINQQIEIADKISGSRFSVNEVQLMPNTLTDANVDVPEIVLQPLSPLVVGKKNNRGHYDFLSPVDTDFNDLLIHSWIEKYKAVNSHANADILRKQISIEVLTPCHQLKSRLITIKAFTSQQTRIRGFTKFRMKVKAPVPLLELALNAGMGLYSAMGCGCVGVINITKYNLH